MVDYIIFAFTVAFILVVIGVTVLLAVIFSSANDTLQGHHENEDTEEKQMTICIQADGQKAQVAVRWPDGTMTAAQGDGPTRIVLTQGAGLRTRRLTDNRRAK